MEDISGWQSRGSNCDGYKLESVFSVNFLIKIGMIGEGSKDRNSGKKNV